MNIAEYLEVTGSHCRLLHPNIVSMVESVELITRAIAFCRDQKIHTDTMALLSLAVALPAFAQQKQHISYKVSAENSKYTQQHVIDVGDVPGHQVRVYEIYRSFPNNAPVINGLKVKETWTRATSDYTDGNGTSTT